MPWVEFIADFEFRPSPSTSIDYLSGMRLSVTEACAAQAVAAGKAKRVATPKAADRADFERTRAEVESEAD